MNHFYKIVHSDYLQRTRSYAFLITLAISLYATYSFIPLPDAGYTTLRIGNFVGVNNAAWTGYVTAMMTSVFLSLIGFYLVNSNIKKDVDTGVGMIIATTSITNFRYLLSKAVSNFLVLLSITGLIFLMSIFVFLFRHAGYPFEIIHFTIPFILITLPAIFFISSLAVFVEVFLYRYPILINIGFFFIFLPILGAKSDLSVIFDVTGIKTVTLGMQELISQRYGVIDPEASMGFIFGGKTKLSYFTFQGIDWSLFYVFTRLLWIGAGIGLTYVSSLFFHRFEIKLRVKKQKKPAAPVIPGVQEFPPVSAGFTVPQEIKLLSLAKITASYKISPLIKTELIMLLRKGPKWLWLVNIAGMLALIFSPLNIAHQILLPVLWFLQIGRWSDLVTKEKTYRVHYFSYTSYQPLSRLFSAQLLAGMLLSIGLATPLMIRLLMTAQLMPVLYILMGAIFIVLLAVFVGLITGGKKLFEILFFLITYSNVNKIPFIDYFGGVNHPANYPVYLAGIIILLALMSYQWRRFEISRL